ncbi:MAG: NTP transferase domain-containing protein [Dongiaceae bacterium]
MTVGAVRCTGLVLAGSRGPDDPVAQHAGRRHKALVPVAGVPMILRVVRALRAARSVQRVILCMDDAVLTDADPAISEELRAANTIFVPTGATPSESVQGVMHAVPKVFPLLVTTADHPLLTPAMIDHLADQAPAAADVAVGLATASLIRRHYPDAVRTFHRFAEEGYSGCNLFLLRTEAAANAAAFWSAMERHRKRPWRLVAAVGPVTLARFLLGRLSLEAALVKLSDLTGARIAAVVMPFAEAAIDVDKPADLALAEAILARR